MHSYFEYKKAPYLVPYETLGGSLLATCFGIDVSFQISRTKLCEVLNLENKRPAFCVGLFKKNWRLIVV